MFSCGPYVTVVFGLTNLIVGACVGLVLVRFFDRRRREQLHRGLEALKTLRAK